MTMMAIGYALGPNEMVNQPILQLFSKPAMEPDSK